MKSRSVLFFLILLSCTLSCFAVGLEQPANIVAELTWSDIQYTKVGFSSADVFSLSDTVTALPPVELQNNDAEKIGQNDAGVKINAYWQILSNSTFNIVLSVKEAMKGEASGESLDWYLYKEGEQPTQPSNYSYPYEIPIHTTKNGIDYGQQRFHIRTASYMNKAVDTYRGSVVLEVRTK